MIFTSTLCHSNDVDFTGYIKENRPDGRMTPILLKFHIYQNGDERQTTRLKSEMATFTAQTRMKRAPFGHDIHQLSTFIMFA